MQPFCYSISSGNLTANGGSSSPVLQFGNDSDFQIQEIRATGNTSVTVLISISNGPAFSNNALSTSMFSGTNNNGLKFFNANVIVPKASSYTFQFTNNDTSAHTEEIQIWGYKKT